MEMAREQAFKAMEAARLLVEQAGMVKEGPVRHRHPPLKAGCPETEQGIKLAGMGAAVGALVGKGRPVRAPDAVKQRDQTMVEDVEEVSAGGVAGPGEAHQRLGEGRRQRPEATGKPHEIDRQFPARVLGSRRPDDGKIAGGKGRGQTGAEAQRLMLGMTAIADAAGVGPQPLDQTDRLMEVEAVGRSGQLFDHRTARSPANGSHVFQIPGR